MSEGAAQALQAGIDRWAQQSRPVLGDEFERVEGELRGHAEALMASGLDADEALLIALKRISASDSATRGFALDFASTLLEPAAPAPAEKPARRETAGFWVMIGCAAAAAAAIKLPALLGSDLLGGPDKVYLLNLSLFVLPFLALYLAWAKRPARRQLIAVAALLAAGAAVANAYPFARSGATELLTAIHLPIVLWLAVGVIAAGGAWRSVAARMDFTRFTGEWLITYALIALGGGVLTALTVGVFGAIGLDTGAFVSEWLLPCGAMGAVLVAAWLVETRANLVGGVAPMLARVFTPLFAALLVALLVGVVWSRGFVRVERDVLILFDILLVVVLALLLYAFSARDPHAAPGWFDRLQLVLVTCALAVDLYALTSIAIRVGQFGFSANKLAALGLNLLVLVNLAGSAFLQFGLVRRRRDFAQVERWQMRYLPAYAIWAAIVAIIFPLVFRFA